MGKYYSEHELLNNMYDIVDEDGCILTVLDEDTLKGVPHVETPVIHAHWTYDIDDLSPMDSMMICSNCGGYEHIYANGNYCGNCGAKMDEEVQK